MATPRKTHEAAQRQLRKSNTNKLTVVREKKPAAATFKDPTRGALKDALRGVGVLYDQLMRELVDELRPRIERGEFTNLGDRHLVVRTDDARLRFVASKYLNTVGCKPGMVETCPGIALLEWSLPKCDDSLARAAVSVSRYANDDDTQGATTVHEIAAYCLARDIRDAWRKGSVRKGAA